LKKGSKKNIIVLSDLNWSAHLRNLSPDQVRSFSVQDLADDRFERIRRYYEIILKEDADLVLFAGDITGDGFCGHGYQHAFIVLLSLLEAKEIHSVFISGNHDPAENYDIVKDWVADYQYTQEISGEITNIDGIKILGVNYDCSISKRSLSKLITESPKDLDIILAHSQIKRRIRHFDFESSYIFTGHYDRKLLAHRNSIFVALDNDSEEVSYAVVNKQEHLPDQISIKIRQNNELTFSYTEQSHNLLVGQRNSILKVNDQPSFDLLKLENASGESLSRDGEHYLYLKYLRGINYACSLDTMFKVANNTPLGVGDLSLNQIHKLPITANYKISESMIEDYLGDVI